VSKPLGLHCAGCGKRMLRTIESKPAPSAVRRIKLCVSCGEKHVTIETIAGRPRKRRAREVE
jgi:transcriptional regulator NrdR family protein